MNEQTTAKKQFSVKNVFASIGGDKLVLIGAIIVVFAAFTYLNPNFMSWTNVVNITIAAHLIGLVAIGHTYLIIAGQNDLSPGSLAAFSAVLVAVCLNAGMALIPSILITVFAGIVIGAFNAWMVNGIKLQAFIATLVTQTVVRGFAYLMCDGKPLSITDEGLKAMGKMRDPLVNIPWFVWFTIICFLVFGIILAKTKFGRSIYAIGGNEDAARLAGLRPKRIITTCFIMMGALTSMGGVFYAGRMNAGQPAANINLEFDAITAVILGGVSFAGGVGNMSGTVLGVLLIQMFNTGLTMVNVNSFWQYVARGALLLFALTSDYIRKERRNKELLAASMKNI
ncbi:MAG: ABC transporter permease [Eubacteriales bacterium]